MPIHLVNYILPLSVLGAAFAVSLGFVASNTERLSRLGSDRLHTMRHALCPIALSLILLNLCIAAQLLILGFFLHIEVEDPSALLFAAISYVGVLFFGSSMYDFVKKLTEPLPEAQKPPQSQFVRKRLKQIQEQRFIN